MPVRNRAMTNETPSDSDSDSNACYEDMTERDILRNSLNDIKTLSREVS